jgi:hypothetical protein
MTREEFDKAAAKLFLCDPVMRQDVLLLPSGRRGELIAKEIDMALRKLSPSSGAD